MDTRETSAMTEASGLTGEQDGVAPNFSQDIAIRLAEQLREVTIKAPLLSLLIAFVLGMWVARRR
jgi:hypothetical protein